MELVKHDRRTSGATPCFSTSAHLGQDTQTASHLHLTARPHQKCPPWRPEGGQPSQSQKCIGNYHFKVPRRRRDQANVQLCVAKGDTNCIRMPNGFWVGFFFLFFYLTQVFWRNCSHGRVSSMFNVQMRIWRTVSREHCQSCTFCKWRWIEYSDLSGEEGTAE